MEYKVLAYYSVEPLSNPQEEVVRHKEFLEKLDFTGRIYLSEQGINGQACGSSKDADLYMAWMHEKFPKIQFKIHHAREQIYPRMTVKYRRQLVAIDCEVDFSLAGEHVSSDRWEKMIQERDENTLILDVRNDYEWKIGHFEGSELPQLSCFRQFPEYAKKLKSEKDPSKTKVMMYCTGGIRCEYFSAVMKKEGFDRVYQLDGGVIQYGLDKPADEWKGKLFVFDDRVVVDVGEEKQPISECERCATSCSSYYNCANTDCNKLFLCCSSCLPMHKGCCSNECSSATRVRPMQSSAKPFRKCSHEEKQAWKSSTQQSV